jgi:trimeric autotransporter adhesin
MALYKCILLLILLQQVWQGLTTSFLNYKNNMKKITTVFVLLALAYNVEAQSVGIGTTTPEASAALEIKSNTKGLLIPVMTSISRNAIAAPAKGLMVYDSSAKAFYYHTGTAWKSFGSANVLADADGNTKVEVERTANDDIVRITTGGTDHTWFQKNNTGAYPLLNFPANGAGNFLLGTQSGWNLKPTILGNTFIGINAGYLDSLGDYNTFVGESSGYYATGSRSVNIGARAGYNTGNGNHNVNIGMEAGWGATNTNLSIHIGSFSGLYDSANNRNIAIGYGSLYNNKSDGNIAIGTGALANNIVTGIYAGGQIAIGDSALYNNSGAQNTAIGNKALFSNTIGNANTANGAMALYNNTTGQLNTANGAYTLYSCTTGEANTATGFEALSDNSTGSFNTANGAQALYSNTIGNSSTANGYYALSGNSTGSFNTANGYFALYRNITGSYNSAFGYDATTSSFNLENATAIGAKAYVGASNSMVLGSIAGVNFATASTNVGIGTTTPTVSLEVQGGIKTKYSGSNVVAVAGGTSFINLIIPSLPFGWDFTNTMVTVTNVDGQSGTIYQAKLTTSTNIQVYFTSNSATASAARFNYIIFKL